MDLRRSDAISESPRSTYVQISLALGTLVYFFGYLILLRRNEDVTVAFVYDRLPPIVRDLLDILISSAIVLFFAVLLYASLSYYRLTHAMMHPILPVAQSTTILPIAVGAAGSLWVAIYKAAVNIRTFVETGGIAQAGNRRIKVREFDAIPVHDSDIHVPAAVSGADLNGDRPELCCRWSSSAEIWQSSPN